jgi:ribosome-binding ATPase
LISALVADILNFTGSKPSPTLMLKGILQMRLGITGLPQSGKSTMFAALTGARGQKDDAGHSRSDQRIAAITVLDERVDLLTEILKPKKTTLAKIEYLLPSDIPSATPSKAEGGTWNQVRACDALLQVVRNFQGPGGIPPTSEKDFRQLEEEMILSDLVVAEKRIEKIELDRKRGRKPEGEELQLVQACCSILEKGDPIRSDPRLASDPLLRGFTFLSSKPSIVLVNNGDEDEEMPQWERPPEDMEILAVRGRLEMDIASMTDEESKEFREAYNIQETALDRVIRKSYQALKRISFFTVLSDEVRAWSVTAGTRAREAAGTVHSDMEKGFIRAETLSFDDLKAYGSFQEAKKAGVVRLEGKDYVVQDGDIINFRFNV